MQKHIYNLIHHIFRTMRAPPHHQRKYTRGSRAIPYLHPFLFVTHPYISIFAFTEHFGGDRSVARTRSPLSGQFEVRLG